MGLFSKDIKSMDDLLLHVLQDINYADKQVAKALPDFIDRATNRELTAALKDWKGELDKQSARLEQGFALLGEKPKGTSCPAIDGIIDEAKDIVGEIDNKRVLDAALLAAVQAVAHYRIVRYGTAATWAGEMDKAALARLLAATLGEVKAADKVLTAIAESKVNARAAG